EIGNAAHGFFLAPVVNRFCRSKLLIAYCQNITLCRSCSTMVPPVAAKAQRSLRPRLLAPPDPLPHFGLELRRAERIPLLGDAVEPRGARGGRKTGEGAGGGGPSSTGTATSTANPRQAKLAASRITPARSGRIHSGKGLLAASQPQMNARHGSCG